MDITTSNIGLTEGSWNYSDTVHFNGIPCRVLEEVSIVLDRQGKSTGEFVESKEFQMLETAGIEVRGRF